jgi:hypothetical protein
LTCFYLHWSLDTFTCIGPQVDLPTPSAQEDVGGFGASPAAIAALFAEELGLVVEVSPAYEGEVVAAYEAAGVPVTGIGFVNAGPGVEISVGGAPQISGEPLR